MNVNLLVTLITCAMVVNSQSTISVGDFVQCDDLKSEIESIHQMLTTQQQASEEIKSQIKEIRNVVIRQQNQPRQGCPPGFDYLPEVGSCFTLIFETMTWDNATERCRGIMPGVHLAAITSQEENDAITRYLRPQFNGDNDTCFHSTWPPTGNVIWIGGQTRNPRRCSDPYVWKPLRGVEIPFNYTNWSLRNPDCFHSAENCVQITTGNNYSWNDDNCDSFFCAICEIHV